MKRRLIFFILALAFFLGAVTFYINTVTIPKDLKKIVILETQKFLNRKISLKDIHFNPFTGFVLSGVTVFEQESRDAFATVDRIRIHVLYWPLFRQQKLVLSSVELKGVSANIVHYGADIWNFSDILEYRAKLPKRNKMLKVYLSKLILSDGYLKLTELEDGFQFSETFNPMDAAVTLSFSKGVTFGASTSFAGGKSWLEVTGNYQPLAKQLTANVKSTNLAVKRYLHLAQVTFPFNVNDFPVHDMNINVSHTKGALEAGGELTLGAFTLQNETQSLTLKSLALKQAAFGLIDGEVQFAGHILADDLNISSKGDAYAAQAVDIQVDQWTSHGDIITAAASLHAMKAQVQIPEKLAFKGDARLDNLKLVRNLKTWSAEGAAQLYNSLLAVGTTVHVSGDFTTPAMAVAVSPEATAVQGNLFADKLIYQWPGKELRGQVALTNIIVQGSPQTSWTIQTDARGQGLELKLPRGNVLKTDLLGQAGMIYTMEDKSFRIKTAYQLSNGIFAMTNGISITGSPSGNAVILSKPAPDKPVPYTGTMEFKEGSMHGTKIGEIDNIRGSVSFTDNKAETSGLSFLALGMPARLTGTLEDFSAPSLDVRIRLTDFDLAAAREIIPDIIDRNQLTLAGTAVTVDVTYKGLLVGAKDANIGFNADVQNSTITSGKINKTLTKVYGAVSYQEKVLSWKDLHADYEGKPYLITGKLLPSGNSSHPSVETELDAEHIKIKTRFEFTPEAMVFQQLTGRFKNAVFNVQGTMKKSSDGSPLLDLTGDADVELAELADIFPKLPEAIKNCRLTGMTHIAGSFAGSPSHWQDWHYNLTGASPQFSIWGLNITNMKFNAVQKNNLLKPFHVWGEFYNGDLNFTASLDTAKKDLPFEMVLRVLDSDLKKLSADTPLKKQSLAGTLSATAIIDGKLTDLKAVNGKGGIDIKEGLLWELDLLKGLGGILLIPEYKNIVFTQAGMNFTMTEGLMSTDNIQLVGPSLSLYGRGSLDFNKDQALNLYLTPDFNTDVILDSSSLKKGTTAIITGTEKFMSVNVTGTLSKPQYKVNKSPVKILQKTGGVILENVSQFFQNIF